MSYIKRIIAGTAAMVMLCAVSCDDNKSAENRTAPTENIVPTEAPTESSEEKIKGTTITWLADFSLDSQDGSGSPTALSLFRDYYGCDVEFVPIGSDGKYATLEYLLNCGDPIDMFPYDRTAMPQGVVKELFDPLDSYFEIMGVNEGLWDDMKPAMEKLKFNGAYYVMPYSVSSPDLVMYSRKLVKKEKLDDPYELYKQGKWDWDVMMDMMGKFVSNAEAGTLRYGINGSFGEALLASTGKTAVNYENGKFSNNIKDKDIAAAENFMKKISDENLYNPNWHEFYPNDNSTLFYIMGDWALGMTNAKNAKKDIMVVPFPKIPDGDKYYISCDYDAKMLVKWSANPDAVAAYMKCERTAALEDSYKEIEKKALSVKEKDAYNKWKPFVTEEQYDAVQSYLETAKENPYFDFGYGMGEKMYGLGDLTYDTRGVMNNLTEAFVNGERAVESWEQMCDDMTEKANDEIKKYNG